jgi:hypothetical protein
MYEEHSEGHGGGGDGWAEGAPGECVAVLAVAGAVYKCSYINIGL